MAVLINQVEIVLGEQPDEQPPAEAGSGDQSPTLRRAEVSAVDFEYLVEHRHDRALRRQAH